MRRRNSDWIGLKNVETVVEQDVQNYCIIAQLLVNIIIFVIILYTKCKETQLNSMEFSGENIIIESLR